MPRYIICSKCPKPIDTVGQVYYIHERTNKPICEQCLEELKLENPENEYIQSTIDKALWINECLQMQTFTKKKKEILKESMAFAPKGQMFLCPNCGKFDKTRANLNKCCSHSSIFLVWQYSMKIGQDNLCKEAAVVSKLDN